MSSLRGLLPFLRPYRARIALAFVLLCLGSATLLLVPLAFRDLVDFGTGNDSYKADWMDAARPRFALTCIHPAPAKQSQFNRA